MRALLLLVVVLAAGSVRATDDVICETYVVQPGDTPYTIAAKFNVLTEELEAALEDCVGYTGVLQIGQKICLPGWVPNCEFVIDSNGVENCKIYQIQQGDTYTTIASTFGIYDQDLISLNADLMPGTLQVGKFIRLPSWTSACPDPDSDAKSCRIYTVQAGDFPFGIASVFRISLPDLLSVNPGLSQGTVLQAGQRIKIPPFPDSCGSGIAAKPPTTGIFACRAYIVKTGDSLSRIALLFQTTQSALQAANPELYDPALLQPGKTVKIPPYPAECINGILIDPQSNAPATPAGPATQFPPATPSPSPSATPSPVPAVPSPKPTVPSPAPVVPSPTPTVPSPSPTPSPATPSVAPAMGIKVSFTLTGIAPDTFITTKSSPLAASFAALMGVPASWVTVALAPAPSRRLQAAGEATSVVVTVASATPPTASAKFQSAVSSGSVTSMFSQLGLTANSIAVLTYPSASPTSPAPSASPQPTPSPAETSSSGGSSSHMGAIIGGVVGGVGGALLVAGVAFFIIKKRRSSAGGGESGLRTKYGATAHVSAGPNLTVKTAAGRLVKEDTGVSSSPRNSVTPRTRMGQMA